MSNSDLRRVWKAQQATKQDVTNAIPALMGNGHGVVQVPNQPGYVYIRLGQGDLGQAYNNRCPLTDNLAIYVGYDPVLDPDRRIFQVLSVRMADYAGAGGTPTPNVPPHHLTHEYGGGDDVYISWRRLMGFRVGRPSGFQVTVDEGVIIRAGAWLSVAAQTLDLTALKPGGALGCYVLIVLNAAGTATATAGASVGIGTLDISDCPLPGASEFPLAAVRLYGAQTSIGDTPTAPDIVDLRFPQAMSTGDVHLEDLSDYARGHIIRGGAADWESYHAANAGFIVQGDGTDVKSLQFDWDTFSAGAGADMVHDHTSNAEGGMLSGVLPNAIMVAYNYKMGATYRIGTTLATSERGVGALVEPTIDAGAGWESSYVVAPCLVEDNKGVLWLFYSGYNGSVYAIGVARSYDGGTTWTKYGSNPVLSASQAWENDGANSVSYCQVLYDREETDASRRWKMWYIGGAAGHGGIGYAYSTDGLSWTKYASNPVIVPTGGGSDWNGYYLQPGAIVRLGSTFYLFYSGSPDPTISWKSGLATFTDPEGTYTQSASNPLLVGDSIDTTITGDVGIGNTSIAVTSSAAIPVGTPVWVYDATNHYLSHVAAKADSTHVTLRDAAPVAIAAATGHVKSAAYNSVTITSAVYDGGWRFGFAAFQPGIAGLYAEASMLSYSADLDSILIDYGAGLFLTITLAESQGATVSRENPSILYLWRTYDRYLKGEPLTSLPIHTHATNPQGGQLDWDNVWSDAVHDHSAAGEGGKLAQANTHESPDTDSATSSLHHTIGVTATTAAAGNHTHASGSGGDHVHGLMRWAADGGATIDLVDIAEYMESISDDGAIVDPLVYTLSADGSQVVFDSGPTAASVMTAQYVIARI